VLPGFFNSVDLSRVLAKVREAAAVARKTLLEVIRLGDYKLTISMLSKGVQCML
jgi:hypothetical protein